MTERQPPETLEVTPPDGPTSTPQFRHLTLAVTLLAVLSVWLVARTEPAVWLASPWYLAAAYALFVYALAAPGRMQRFVNGHLGDLPDVLIGIPLIVLSPFPVFASVAVAITFVICRRLGIDRWSSVFNAAQAVLGAAVAATVVHAATPHLDRDLTWSVVGAVTVAAVARELVGEVLSLLGCRLDGLDDGFTWTGFRQRQVSNLVAVIIALCAIHLAGHGLLGGVLSFALLGATVANGEVAAREANQRWLAEAVSESGERIRAATTHDEVLGQLAREVAHLWRAPAWRLRARTAHPGREADEHSVTVPLVAGHELVLVRPEVGVPVAQMYQTTETLARMADERERVLRFQRRLELQASRDDLTGLGNRTRLWEMLDAALPHTSVNNRLAAVYIDIDRFKTVNDTYGHTVGDALLRLVAGRLLEHAGRVATPVRLSGDEFVLVVKHAPDDDALLAWARHLCEELGRPYSIEGSVLNVSFAIGIAVSSTPPQGRSELLAATDAAVARAKNNGRGSVVLATAEVVAESRRLLRLEGELRDALDDDEFQLHYQPIVDTQAGRVVAVEALIRWYRDGAVWMRPDEFISHAEESGLISQIGLWVLRRACTQMRDWNARYRPDDPLSVSINVSTVHIAQPTFVRDVARILEETGFPPELLIIEITETFALLDLEKSIELGAELKSMGVALWLDDFGTGYSSLEYVRQLPVAVVKLDRSFIVDLGSDATTRTFIESLVALCRSIDRVPMAEGVERPEQRALLAELGCTIQQGYHFARPMTVEDLGDYVTRSDESVLPRRSA